MCECNACGGIWPQKYAHTHTFFSSYIMIIIYLLRQQQRQFDNTFEINRLSCNMTCNIYTHSTITRTEEDWMSCSRFKLFCVCVSFISLDRFTLAFIIRIQERESLKISVFLSACQTIHDNTWEMLHWVSDLLLYFVVYVIQYNDISIQFP